MHRSHSKRTHPAKKSIPKELLKKTTIWTGDVIEPTPEQRKQVKHVHIRRSRRFLKQSQRWEIEDEL
jgi:hypothetical protein